MAHGRLEVLAVGDVVIDAFIKLLDNQEKIENDKNGPCLSIPFGTKIPYDHAEIVPAVGNASNASVAFAKLGLKSGLVANVGGDDNGRDILGALHKAKVDARFVHIN